MTALTSSEASPIAEAAQDEKIPERLLRVAAWLSEGRSRSEILAAAVKHWDVSRRTAQLYLQKVERRLAHEAARTDPSFQLKLAQLQRERLLRLGHCFLRRASKADDVNAAVLGRVTGLLSAMGRLLDGRDRAALLLHRRLGQEDKAPDQLRAEAAHIQAEARLLDVQTHGLIALGKPVSRGSPSTRASAGAVRQGVAGAEFSKPRQARVRTGIRARASKTPPRPPIVASACSQTTPPAPKSGSHGRAPDPDEPTVVPAESRLRAAQLAQADPSRLTALERELLVALEPQVLPSILSNAPIPRPTKGKPPAHAPP